MMPRFRVTQGGEDAHLSSVPIQNAKHPFAIFPHPSFSFPRVSARLFAINSILRRLLRQPQSPGIMSGLRAS